MDAPNSCYIARQDSRSSFSAANSRPICDEFARTLWTLQMTGLVTDELSDGGKDVRAGRNMNPDCDSARNDALWANAPLQINIPDLSIRLPAVRRDIRARNGTLS